MIGETIGNDSKILDKDENIIDRISVFSEKAKEVADLTAKDFLKIIILNGFEFDKDDNNLGSDDT